MGIVKKNKKKKTLQILYNAPVRQKKVTHA